LTERGLSSTGLPIAIHCTTHVTHVRTETECVFGNTSHLNKPLNTCMILYEPRREKSLGFSASKVKSGAWGGKCMTRRMMSFKPLTVVFFATVCRRRNIRKEQRRGDSVWYAPQCVSYGESTVWYAPQCELR
jgi:hypothetical protein